MLSHELVDPQYREKNFTQSDDIQTLADSRDSQPFLGSTVTIHKADKVVVRRVCTHSVIVWGRFAVEAHTEDVIKDQRSNTYPILFLNASHKLIDEDSFIAERFQAPRSSFEPCLFHLCIDLNHD